MGILETLESELRGQIFSKPEETEIDERYIEFSEWDEGYSEGYRAGIDFALSRILFHKTQKQIYVK